MTSDPSAERAILTIDRGIAVLTLNEPARLNAFDLAMARRLKELAAEVESRTDVRVLVVRGNGRSFCAGADIQLFVENLDDIGPPVRAILSELGAFIASLRRMDKIVLMSVHGAVAGGGMAMVSHADLCIAAAGTRFTPAYNRLALPPDMGATFSYPRLIGIRRSLQAFLCEEHLSAEVALEWGLINWIVSDERLTDETLRIAGKIAANAPEAIAATKRLFYRNTAPSLAAQMSEETANVVHCLQQASSRAALARLVCNKGNPGGPAGGKDSTLPS